MKTKPIKLPYNLVALRGQTSGMLNEAIPIRNDQITSVARLYATEYYTVETKKSSLVDMVDQPKEVDYYKLPGGTLLRLCLMGNLGIPFACFVRSNDRTWKYFEERNGQEFEIIIEPPPVCDNGKLDL